MDGVVQKGGPQQNFAGLGLYPVLGVDLPIFTDGVHVRLWPGIKKRYCARCSIGTTGKFEGFFRNCHIVGSRKPSVRMVVQVVIVTKAINVCPSLQVPIKRIVNFTIFDITNYGMVDTVS